MSPQSKRIGEIVSQVRSRIRARQISRGVTLTLAATVVWVIIAGFLAGRLRDGGAMLILLRFSPILVAGVSAWFFIARPLRSSLDSARLARLVEERTGLNDRLVTAVEYSENYRAASPAIVDRLVEDATTRASAVPADKVVDPRRTYGYSAASGAIILVAILGLVLGPTAITDGIGALYGVGNESVSANAMFIGVNPGTTRVPRGSDIKIKATLTGFDSLTAQIFTRKVNADGWSGRVMEPAKNVSEFQTVLFNMQDSMSYYIESNGIRSSEFMLEVADLPFVKQLDLVLKFPAYTRLPEKKIEDGGEVAALKGTVVTVLAKMSAAAKTARIVLNDGQKFDMAAGPDNNFIGQFPVKQNGTYKIEVTSDDGRPYNGSNEYDITVLEDNPPTVLIDKPGRDMKVTSIQEVFTQVRAEDDYGVSGIELHYSVNGGEEKIAKLQDLTTDSPKSLSGAHTFFLEEYGLKPGDFISYYATAKDNIDGTGRQATSDIYFLEVRPFDRQFRQAQQQGQQGGGEQDSNALTRRQREIVAATFRVQREQESYTKGEKDENFSAVQLSQEKLKADTESLAERIKRRLGDQLGTQQDFAKLVEYLAQAAKEMDAAVNTLKAQNTKESLPPEQRALQQLLRAEAIFRDIQVARGQGQGQGSQQEQQELADLFELQLDKMKNQYETVQSGQQASQNQQQDELARRLKELAQRQQKELEGRMRAEMQQGGGGGGSSQRQQQEMIEEAQKMARELERLSRERRDPKLAEAAQQMQQAANEMRQAQSQQQRQQQQQNSSGQGGNTQSNAQQLRALERMEQARRLIESSGRSGGQKSVQGLRQQAEEALRRQDEISRGIEDLAQGQQGGQPREGGQSAAGNQQKKQQIGERKQALADQMSGLERDIEQAARGMGQERQQAGDKLREAAGAIRNNRIPDRIRQNQQMVEQGWFDQARERESVIRKNMEQVLKNLQAAEGGAGKRSESESLEEALNRARELADSLDSLRRRIESQQGDQQSQQGQAGQRSGEQNAQGSQSGRNQQSQSGQQAQGQQNGQRQGQQGQQAQGQQAQGQQGQQGQRGQRGQQGRQGQQGQRGQRGEQGQQAQGQGREGQQGQQGQGQQSQQGQQGQGQQSQQGQGQGQGGRQGQQGQQGQGQGQQGQQGQAGGGRQPGGRQSNQAGSQPTMQNDSAMVGGGPPQPGDRQIASELRERIAEAEELRRQLGRNNDLARELGRAIDELRKINPNVFSDPAQLAALKNEVIEPLRQLEIELARRLQAKLGNPGAGTFGSGEAPDRYRRMIEDYYRRLSMRSPDSKP